MLLSEMKQLTIILSLFVTPLMAQVEVDKPIQFNGATNADKQVTGLRAPDHAGDAVNASSVQYGTMIFGTATGTNILNVNINPPVTAYQAGMSFNIMCPNSNTGAMQININGLGAVPLKKEVTLDLDSADIYPNQVISIIYDGSNFQLLSQLNKRCPSGFVSASANYCIETDERATDTFWNAVVSCHDSNARLCSWGEWYHACQNTGLGLNNMTNNYEFVDAPANSNIIVRIAGAGTCKIRGDSFTTAARPFRCCYSK